MSIKAGLPASESFSPFAFPSKLSGVTKWFVVRYGGATAWDFHPTSLLSSPYEGEAPFIVAAKIRIIIDLAILSYNVYPLCHFGITAINNICLISNQTVMC